MSSFTLLRMTSTALREARCSASISQHDRCAAAQFDATLWAGSHPRTRPGPWSCWECQWYLLSQATIPNRHFLTRLRAGACGGLRGLAGGHYASERSWGLAGLLSLPWPLVRQPTVPAAGGDATRPSAAANVLICLSWPTSQLLLSHLILGCTRDRCLLPSSARLMPPAHERTQSGRIEGALAQAA
ncbi:hypothetical protein BDZ91DRAFT_767750 [Kalaharituber pfeilii]|nr:hypothetical protein BDZ91DRAFT_767750 [Kalaharituber pfeilii]